MSLLCSGVSETPSLAWGHVVIYYDSIKRNDGEYILVIKCIGYSSRTMELIRTRPAAPLALPLASSLNTQSQRANTKEPSCEYQTVYTTVRPTVPRVLGIGDVACTMLMYTTLTVYRPLRSSCPKPYPSFRFESPHVSHARFNARDGARGRRRATASF